MLQLHLLLSSKNINEFTFIFTGRHRVDFRLRGMLRSAFVINPKNLPAIFFIPHERAILLVKCDFSYSCAAADKVSTDLSARAVSAAAELLVKNVSYWKTTPISAKITIKHIVFYSTVVTHGAVIDDLESMLRFTCKLKLVGN